MYFDYRTITLYGAGFQQLLLYIHFVTLLNKLTSLPYNPGPTQGMRVANKLVSHTPSVRPVWAVPVSLAATKGISRHTSHCFLFLQVLRCFTSLGTLVHHLRMNVIEVYSIGFPHSEISGSKVKDTSPKRIAVFRVFHRHVEPRHPPYALDFLLGNLEIINSLNTLSTRTGLVFY